MEGGYICCLINVVLGGNGNWNEVVKLGCVVGVMGLIIICENDGIDIFIIVVCIINFYENMLLIGREMVVVEEGMVLDMVVVYWRVVIDWNFVRGMKG